MLLHNKLCAILCLAQIAQIAQCECCTTPWHHSAPVRGRPLQTKLLPGGPAAVGMKKEIRVLTDLGMDAIWISPYMLQV